MNNPCVKKDISVGDRVVVLSDRVIMRGEVIKVNRKTYKVYYGGGAFRMNTKNFSKEKVAHVDDVVSIVCDYSKSINGNSVRFDYVKYPDKSKKASLWLATPCTYVAEY